MGQPRAPVGGYDPPFTGPAVPPGAPLLILAALGLEVRALRPALTGAVPITRIPRLGGTSCTGWLGWHEPRAEGNSPSGRRPLPDRRPDAGRALRRPGGGEAGRDTAPTAPASARPVLVLQTGMSGAGLGAGGVVGAIRATRPAAILAVGFGGGLAPTLAVGDLVLADPVVDPSVPRYWWPAVGLASTAAAAARRAGLALHTGPVLSVSRVEASPAGKAVVAGRSAALALDMESAGFARAAAEAAVPFLAVRVISDAAGDRLPDEPWRLVTVDGRAPLGRALRYLGRRPGALPGLLRAGLRARRAAATLTAFLGAFLAEQGR